MAGEIKFEPTILCYKILSTTLKYSTTELDIKIAQVKNEMETLFQIGEDKVLLKNNDGLLKKRIIYSSEDNIGKKIGELASLIGEVQCNNESFKVRCFAGTFFGWLFGIKKYDVDQLKYLQNSWCEKRLLSREGLEKLYEKPTPAVKAT